MSTRPFSTSSCPAAATTTRTLSDLADAIFTPPASCLDSTYRQSPYGYDTIDKYTDSSTIRVTGSQGQVTYTTTYTLNFVVKGRDPSCFPRNFPTTTCLYDTVVSSITEYRVSEQSYIYSPGRCPENYVTAKSSIDESNTDITRAICCPVNYVTYDFDYTGAAECWRAPDTSVTYLQGNSIYRFSADELYAPTIQIAWQRTDLARWANGPATSTPTTSISEPSSTLSTSSSPAGLSTGAKAGIGVGAAAAGLLVIAIIVYLVLRRRRRARNVHQDVHHDVMPGPQQARSFQDGKRQSELTGLQEYQTPPMQQFQQPPKSETYRHVAESHDPAELESGWRGWEAPTTGTQISSGHYVETSGRDEIHVQGSPNPQSPPAVSPIR